MIEPDEELDLDYLGGNNPKINPRFCKECVHDNLGHNNTCKYCKEHSLYDQPVYFSPALYQEDKGHFIDPETGHKICKTCAAGIHLHHKTVGDEDREKDCKNLIPDGNQCMCYKQCNIEEES